MKALDAADELDDGPHRDANETQFLRRKNIGAPENGRPNQPLKINREGGCMKKQIARTVTILSLLVMLSVVANNVYAFPAGCPSCYQYSASASAHSTPHAVAADAPSDASGSFIFWLQLAMLFGSL